MISEKEVKIQSSSDCSPVSQASLSHCITALSPRSIEKHDWVKVPTLCVTGGVNSYSRVGRGVQTKFDCGEIYGAASCPTSPDHDKVFFKHTCHKNTCPTCYEQTISRAAHRAEDKLHGIKKELIKHGFNVGKYRHVVWSQPPQLWTKQKMNGDGGKAFIDSFKKAFKSNTKYFGGVFILHCERKKHSDGTECGVHGCTRKHHWEWGPHIHYIGWGYFNNSALVHSKTGWMYKTIDDGGRARNVYDTVNYQLSHAATFKSGQQIVRYIGMATWGGKRIISKKREPVECSFCGSQLIRRTVYPDGTIDLTTDQGPCTHLRLEYAWYIRRNRLKKECYGGST